MGKVKVKRYDNSIRKKKVRIIYRESPYNEDAGQRLIDMMAEGKTLAQFLADYGIAHRTFYDWTDNYPEFKEAYDVALTKSEAYHDAFFEANMLNPEFNERVFLEKTKRIFGNRQKRRTRTSYLKAKELTESLQLMIDNAENNHVDLEELQTYTKSIANIAAVKANHELTQKIQDLEKLILAKEENE